MSKQTSKVIVILSLIILGISLLLLLMGYISKIEALKIVGAILAITSSLGSLSVSISLVFKTSKIDVSGNNNLVAGQNIIVNNNNSYSKEQIEIFDKVYNLLYVEGRIIFDNIIRYFERKDLHKYVSEITHFDSLWRRCMNLTAAELSRDNPQVVQYKSLLGVLGYFLSKYRRSDAIDVANQDLEYHKETLMFLKSIQKDLIELKPIKEEKK